MLRRAAVSGGLLLAAVLIQLIIVDNLRLPGGASPDLVLVVVVAVALTGGPMEGMLGGFCAGLALDVAPPATHLVGQYALVFCLVGYACGRLRVSLDHSAWLPICVVAVGSAAGELLYALTGMTFGDPDITWTAVRQVLPASVLYDVLLSPFVLYAVARARGVALQGLSALHGGESPNLLTPGLAAAAGLAGASGAVVRDSGTGRAPRLSARSLRAGATQGGSASGGRGPARAPGRPVQLHFGGAGGLQGGSASSPRIPRQPPSRPVSLRLGSKNWASRFQNGAPSRPVNLRLGSKNWASRFQTAAPSRPASLRLGSKNWISRYRGGALNGAGSGGLLGDGAGGRALRPSRGPRLRGSMLPGGSASGTRISLSRPVRPVHLRLGSSARRRDGAIGGSVLGRARGGRVTGSRQFSGRAFGSKSALGRRSPVGKTHVPRFRGVKSSALMGRRGPAAAPGRGTFSRRRPLWRIFGKRTGGVR